MLGVHMGSGDSRSPSSQVPPFSKHLEKGFLWVIPASRVAMDTSPLANGFCPLLTFLGTSCQAHLFVMSLIVAKYNLGKVRLELMQSAVFPFTVRDLQGSPLEICGAFVLRCLFSCSAVC